jgi:hypothetical protein
MRLVKTGDGRAGQRAARDITDLRGNLLLKAGGEFTAEILATCRQRNISHLFVEADDGVPSLSPTDLQARRDFLMKDVDRMFSGVDDTPTMAALREASKRHLSSRLDGK